MPSLRVDIVRFVDEYQPGIVECLFNDVWNQPHTIVDKIPLFTEEGLGSDSKYPQPGSIRCEVLDRSIDVQGRRITRITIAQPDNLESADGTSEFVVFDSEVSN